MPKGYWGNNRNWTARDSARVVEMIEDHRSYAEIAAALGRTEKAVQVWCKRHGLSVTKSAGHTVNSVARLMGVDAKTVARWCDRGWLKAHRTGLKAYSGSIRVVEHEYLLGWLEDPRYWHLWQPERIQDHGIREWAMEMRAGVRFLTVGEAAERMGVHVSTVNSHIHRGLIRAVRRGNWVIREADAVYTETSRKGQRRGQPLSAEEQRIVRRWWGREPVSAINRRLGRPPGAKVAYYWAKRNGLPRLGSGYWRRGQTLREEKA